MKSCTCKHCNKQYEVKIDKVDDGFCSDVCWIITNCGEPETIERVLEEA